MKSTLLLAVELFLGQHWSVWALAGILLVLASILRETRWRLQGTEGIFLLWSLAVIAHLPLVKYSRNAKFDLSPLVLAHAFSVRLMISSAALSSMWILGSLRRSAWAPMRRVFLIDVCLGFVGLLAIARVFSSSIREARDALLFSAIALPAGDIVTIAVAAASIWQYRRKYLRADRRC